MAKKKVSVETPCNTRACPGHAHPMKQTLVRAEARSRSANDSALLSRLAGIVLSFARAAVGGGRRCVSLRHDAYARCSADARLQADSDARICRERCRVDRS